MDKNGLSSFFNEVYNNFYLKTKKQIEEERKRLKEAFPESQYCDIIDAFTKELVADYNIQPNVSEGYNLFKKYFLEVPQTDDEWKNMLNEVSQFGKKSDFAKKLALASVSVIEEKYKTDKHSA